MQEHPGQRRGEDVDVGIGAQFSAGLGLAIDLAGGVDLGAEDVAAVGLGELRIRASAVSTLVKVASWRGSVMPSCPQKAASRSPRSVPVSGTSEAGLLVAISASTTSSALPLQRR